MSLEVSGKAIIFSAPSGAGKTTIVKHLLKVIPGLRFSISACSREKRKGEEDGVDYYFFGVEKFKQAIQNDLFVEYEEVYKDNFYGTLKSEVQRIWKEGNVVIFDVDVVGGLNLKKIFGENAFAVFVKAPSLKVLENRLRSRKTETEEKILTRLAKAKQEMEYAPHFDFVLENEMLENAFIKAEEVVKKFLLTKN